MCLNKCHHITWELCVKYYYMVPSSVSDLDLRRMQFLEVDVTGPRRFLCSKDRFDWDMACHARVSLWVLEFYFPAVYWSTYPQEADRHTSPERIGSNSMTLIDWTFHTQWPAIVLSAVSWIVTLACCSVVQQCHLSLQYLQLLDCSPTVCSYSFLTIHHECWRGGAWLWSPHEGSDKGFDCQEGFTNWFPETSNLWLELIRPIQRFLTLHQGHGKLVHTSRYTFCRWRYHTTGVSAQLLGSH